jgi:hypothetical protein
MNFHNCIYCERDSDQIPLLSLVYKDQRVSICPQHLPILIHNPEKLADKLSGAENFQPADQHDHH